jgi:protein-lysine N-methyltransferase EEF2KMT
MADVDPQLRLFRRQYLQLFEPDFLAWPHAQLLRRSDAQAWLYRHLFNESRNPRLPPERYQLRVLRPLIARIEKAVQDPDEDVRERAQNHIHTYIYTYTHTQRQIYR